MRDCLPERGFLLVLDNFEHVLDAAALLGELVAACPRLKLVVTSRAVLRLSSEQVYEIRPMATPDPGRLPPTVDLGRYDAVATVRELRRVLRPGGTLALAYQERARMPPGSAAALSQAGARLFGPGEVEQVARAAGFEEVRVESLGASDGPAGFCLVATK